MFVGIAEMVICHIYSLCTQIQYLAEEILSVAPVNLVALAHCHLLSHSWGSHCTLYQEDTSVKL